MSSSMQKLRNFLPGTGSQHVSASNEVAARNSIILEPEVGFQITIGSSQQSTQTINQGTTLETVCQQKSMIPELNVHLIAARHLPNLFGFKIVQGYQVKVKLFPGSKRLDSSIQTNSWPKFNENFKFPLAPDIKPSLKHSVRQSSKPVVNELFTPEELFAGQFVVFTVYALLELPPASFSRFNKTYRSLRDKSSNLVQKVVESSNGKTKDDHENDGVLENNSEQKSKRKLNEANPRDAIPPLTISESRRNLGSVTCYLEPKLFKRNPRSGLYATEELWLPIKDITTSAKKVQANDLTNSPKGIVEIILQLRDASLHQNEKTEGQTEKNSNTFEKLKTVLTPPSPTSPTTPNASIDLNGSTTGTNNVKGHNVNDNNTNSNNYNNNNNNNNNNNPTKNNKFKNQPWNRMTADFKRKMGISNITKSPIEENEIVLRITTARMRCTQKVKDELECTAGNVYVKTAVFEHGIFVTSWKSPCFYPSLSTKWDTNDELATLSIPLQNIGSLNNILIRTTLATKTKMGKKLVLGTVLIGTAIPKASGNGAMHIQLLHESPTNERISMWHKYQ